MIAVTPKPPYYAVIFTSVRTVVDDGYADMAKQMEELAKQQPGFIGFESAREEIGITVSYWKDQTAIANWKNQMDHVLARKMGREKWYQSFKIRIALVERGYDFEK
ncbi:antibiotic biosynthesis monooxygenase family protein [Sunxiuqinia sp. A32]|uniref:antibiotic biosynthesis monooxygenase family protein n=1 Tax=Sunxiuqinia sp. A32 TaxID=3461496 RepID=UPI004045B225